MLQIIPKSMLNDSEQFKKNLRSLFSLTHPDGRDHLQRQNDVWISQSAKTSGLSFSEKRVGKGPLGVRYTSISGQRL